MDTLALRRSRNVHQKAFSLVGVVNNMIWTVCWALGELKAWDLETFEQTGQQDIPKSLTGETQIIAGSLWGCEENYPGLFRMHLSGM